jgi:carbamoyltransferase
MEYHDRIGYRFIPSLRARVPHEGGGYLLQTNAAGFRCRHEFTPTKPTWKRRILLFGDSFTAGEGVSDGMRFGDHLEQLIPDLDVFNFGLPGTGPDQQWLAYREFGSKIEHDVLVIAVFVENIRRVVAKFRHFYSETGSLVLYAKPYFTLEDGQLVLSGSPPSKRPIDETQLSDEDRQYICQMTRFPALKAAWNSLAAATSVRRLVPPHTKDRLLRMVRYQPIVEYADASNPAWVLMRRILEAWIGNQKGPVLLVTIPLAHYVEGISDPTAYNLRFRELAQSTGCIYHDPVPDLASLTSIERRGLFFPTDGHMTPIGHRVLASSMAPMLTRLLKGQAETLHV